MSYRKLSRDEICCLERQGCSAEDWNNVEICRGTDVRFLVKVRFSGMVRIGVFRRTVIFDGGVRLHSGVYQAMLHNVCVGDDCLIYNIREYIANYDIAALCVVADCGVLAVEGETSFGCGVEVNVADEGGGRQIVIHPHMSAQEALLQAFTRVGLREMAMRQLDKSTRGTMGRATTVRHCTRIINTQIGEACNLDGAPELLNGTVGDKGFVGAGVMARDFIFESHSYVSGGARLTNCHVGQGSHVGSGFTAVHTFFSSNCHAENGEACSVLAGPFTVTHHKSTLLIGAVCSFLNAGSGTNQSNHAYKLGPIHYGILERGTKTASGSHVVWPAHIGAFSLVMGKVPPRTDTSAFPFSYVVGSAEHARIIPAITLRNIGTLRDIKKWPQRDNRPSNANAADDCICFNPFTPYVLQRMAKGEHMLSNLAQTMQEKGRNEALTSTGLLISLKAAQRGADLYRIASDLAIYNMMHTRLNSDNSENINKDVAQILQPTLPAYDLWCDLIGLQAPITEIRRILNDVKEGNIDTLRQFSQRLKSLVVLSDEFTWAWAWARLHVLYPQADVPSLVRIVSEKGQYAGAQMHDLLCADALRDVEGCDNMEYGLCGNTADAEQEMHALRDTLVKDVLKNCLGEEI